MQPKRHASKEELFERVNILDVADFFGLRVEKRFDRYAIECPFHESVLGKPDRNLGNCVTSSNNGFRTCHCFSCGESGNVVKVAMAQTGLKYSEAIDYLAEHLAPDLLEEERTELKTAKQICPVSQEELEAIGLVTQSSVIRALNAGGSRREALGCSTDTVLRLSIPEIPEFTACDIESVPFRNFYAESPEAALVMMQGKAQERKESLQALLSRISMFPDGQMRFVIETDVHKTVRKVEDILDKIKEEESWIARKRHVKN